MGRRTIIRRRKKHMMCGWRGKLEDYRWPMVLHGATLELITNPFKEFTSTILSG
jgi:hypothetical protein